MSVDQVHTGFGDLKYAQDDMSLSSFIAKQMVNGMATATLVQVKAVHTDTVDVQPMVNQIDGAGTGIPHGVIHGLPFFSLRAGAAEIRAKPVVGDIGIALFCHSDISSVKETKKPANPGSRRRFDWGDGIYLGGVLGAAPTVRLDIGGGGIYVTGSIDVTGSVSVGTGATGSFSTAGGGTVTVTDGIITNIA